MQIALNSNARDQTSDVRRYDSGAKDERRKTTKKPKQRGTKPMKNKLL